MVEEGIRCASCGQRGLHRGGTIAVEAIQPTFPSCLEAALARIEALEGRLAAVEEKVARRTPFGGVPPVRGPGVADEAPRTGPLRFRPPASDPYRVEGSS